MKFLITVASYYPVSGGVQMVTQYTAEELVKRGHKVTIITSNSDRSDERVEHNGVKLLYTDVFKKADFTKGDKKAYRELLLSQVKDKDVLINVSLQTPTTDLVLPLLPLIKCKKILYLHDIYDFTWRKDDKKNLKSIVKKLYYNCTRRYYYSYVYKYIKDYNLITHLSPFDISMRYVKKHGIKQNLVLGNAALDSVFAAKHDKIQDDPYFICIANYNDRKNQLFVLESFYNADLTQNVKLVFIGKEENAYYKKLVARKNELDRISGPRNVDFYAGISRDKTEFLLSNASALVLGSTVEMFPVVIIEAMASKIPFISTEVGCVKYQPGGFIAKDSDEMSYWMKFIIDNPNVAQSYGLAGYEFATKNMTVESRVDLLLNSINYLSDNA
ncbi:MAG: glycosyltransferase family 4 protein [Paludibacteraceae bacterium]|nr:glycosyltransferase family 4 protein [Paludibacteraceae bacterium]